MKGQKVRRHRRVDAKRTVFGRFLCRLLGDEAGQAIMEYVVLGVLVVAAAVAAAILFGDTIRDNFLIMVYTIQGDIASANKIKAERAKKAEAGEKKARSDSNTLNDGQMDGEAQEDKPET